MIRLILVRHGNTFEAGQTPLQVGARTDLPLTAEGRNQAQRVANYLLSNNISPAAIYVGSLKRQTESAEIIEKHLMVENRIYLNEPALTEIDYGLWEGLTSDEITSRWPDEYAAWTTQAKWPADIFASTLAAHLSGIEGWLNQLRATIKAGDTVVGITSNGILRFFYSFQKEKGHPRGTIVGAPLVGAPLNLKVKTGHLCELRLFPDRLEVGSWNVDPSLSFHSMTF